MYEGLRNNLLSAGKQKTEHIESTFDVLSSAELNWQDFCNKWNPTIIVVLMLSVLEKVAFCSSFLIWRVNHLGVQKLRGLCHMTDRSTFKYVISYIISGFQSLQRLTWHRHALGLLKGEEQNDK